VLERCPLDGKTILKKSFKAGIAEVTYLIRTSYLIVKEQPSFDGSRESRDSR
jgi:hypothetical protein